MGIKIHVWGVRGSGYVRCDGKGVSWGIRIGVRVILRV